LHRKPTLSFTRQNDRAHPGARAAWQTISTTATSAEMLRVMRTFPGENAMMAYLML